MSDRVEGRHPVMSALQAGRVNEVFVAEGTDRGFVTRLRELARQGGVPVKVVPRARIQDMARTRGHQGVVATVTTFSYASLDELIAISRRSDRSPLLVVAAGVEDPHNLGAMIRVAESAGAHGLVIPQRRSAAVTPAVSRVAAGAVEHLPVARITNLGRAVDTLKEAGIWVYGAEPGAGIRYWEADLKGPVALVLGGEHRGIPRLVREKCDGLISIPSVGQTGSLNVSQAAAIVIYEVVRQRQSAGQS